MRSLILRRLPPVCVAVVLAACGGGGGGSGPSPAGGSAAPPVSVDRLILTAVTPSESSPAGTSAFLRFRLENPSTITAENVSLKLTLGAGLRQGSADCVPTGGDATCPAIPGATTIAALPARSSLDFTISANVEQGATGRVPVVAQVTVANDGVTTNNETRFDVPVYSTDVSLAATTTKTNVIGGDAVSFIVVVSNAGPDVARDVTLAGLLGGRQSLLTMDCTATGGASCPVTPELDMLIPTLVSGGSLTFSLNTQIAGDALASVSASMRAQTAGDLSFTNDTVEVSSFVRVPSTPASPSFVRFHSDEGDSFGRGNDYSYDRLNAIFELEQYAQSTALDISGNEPWRAEFFKPAEQERWEVGTYTDLFGAPFHDPSTGGLKVRGPGMSCDHTGWFKVTNVVYAGDELTALDIIFAQQCKQRAPGLRGQIHWVANDGILPPGPVNPPPSGLWAPAADATPTSGNYVYLASGSGEPILQGESRTFTQANALLGVNTFDRTLEIVIRAEATYSLNLRAMSSVTQIEPGYYAIDPDLPAYNPVYPTLNVAGNARNCTSVIGGWFVIDSIARNNGELTAVDARFEQRCGDSGAPLRGRIHWRSDDPTQPPGPQVPPPGLWAPASGVVPAAGNVIYLEGGAGNYQLNGTSRIFLPVDSIIHVGSDGMPPMGNRLHVSVSGDENWSGHFQAMYSLPDLVAGYYGNLVSFPLNSAITGSIEWSPGSSSCHNARGWFVIDAIAYSGNAIDSFELRFEQYCGINEVPLHGYIRWSTADTRVPLPPQNPPPADLWQPSPGETPPTGNYVYLTDAINGWGDTFLYTQADAEFRMQISGRGIEIDVHGDERWDGHFEPMLPLTQLQAGYYELPIGPSLARGAFDWSGASPYPFCGVTRGWFVVDEVTYEATALRSLDVRFERRCANGAPTLRGKIHWRYDDPTAAPGPVSPVPSGLWQPSVGVVPPSGNVFYAESEPEEFIGDGKTYLVTDAFFQGGTGIDTYYVGAQPPGESSWTIHLDKMNSLPRLQVGFYENAGATLVGNPTRGRMDVSGRSRGCGQYGQGWFAVDAITYDGEQMTAIDVRFEYRCSDTAPALRGKVRWSR